MTSADRADYLPHGADGYFWGNTGATPAHRANVTLEPARARPVAPPLDRMGMPELRKLAKARGLSVPRTASKPDLIRLLS